MNLVHYNSGMSILKTIFGYMRTTLTYNQFIEGLQMTHYGEKIPYSEFQQWVANLGYTKEQFLKIIWKTNSDWDKILRKIASSIPSGKIPTRMMITDAFLNPDTFKASYLDIATLTVKQTAKAASTVSKSAVETLGFLQTYKGPILILISGIVLLKLLKQSDKVKAAYGRISSDVSKGYSRVTSDAARAYKGVRGKK